eukprot:9782515-Prorocentrum_lima.AAC.1
MSGGFVPHLLQDIHLLLSQSALHPLHFQWSTRVFGGEQQQQGNQHKLLKGATATTHVATRVE